MKIAEKSVRPFDGAPAFVPVGTTAGKQGRGAAMIHTVAT